MSGGDKTSHKRDINSTTEQVYGWENLVALTTSSQCKHTTGYWIQAPRTREKMNAGSTRAQKRPQQRAFDFHHFCMGQARTKYNPQKKLDSGSSDTHFGWVLPVLDEKGWDWCPSIFSWCPFQYKPNILFASPKPKTVTYRRRLMEKSQT